MLVDPVFLALQDYKDAHKGDVVRYEMAIRAEIARVHQYQKHPFTQKSREQLKGVENAIIDNLNSVLNLLPAYLNAKFNENLKKTPFWERRALKANSLNWKYTFYAKERKASSTELVDLLSGKTKITMTQVKESSS